MKPSSRTSEPIRAHVVLKGPAGSLTAGSTISSENVQVYVCDPSVRERVRATLEKLGFSIRRVSPLSITVEAAPEQFETVFRGRLKRVGPRHQVPRRRKTAEGSVSPVGPFWTWSQSPEIPEDLQDVIDTIVFPQPTKTLI